MSIPINKMYKYRTLLSILLLICKADNNLLLYLVLLIQTVDVSNEF